MKTANNKTLQVSVFLVMISLVMVGSVSAQGQPGYEAAYVNGETVTIPMNDIVFKELMALKQDAEPQEFVFSNSRTRVNIDSIKTGWRNVCEDPFLGPNARNARPTRTSRLRRDHSERRGHDTRPRDGGLPRPPAYSGSQGLC